MKVQCSIKESTRRSLTESPLKALQGNQDLPGFVYCQASARSAPPDWNVARIDRRNSGSVITGDPMTDAMAYLQWYLRHTWSEQTVLTNPDGSTYFIYYEENDDQDKDTFFVTMTPVLDTFPGGYWTGDYGPYQPPPGAPRLNDPRTFIHLDGPDDENERITSGGSNIWNPNPTFDTMRATVNAVDFSKFWASQPEHDTFQYDRADNVLKSGSLLPISNGAAIQAMATPISQTGSGIGYSANTIFGGGISIGQLNYFRMQVQIRNFVAQVPIPYNFYETIQVSNPSLTGQPPYADGTPNPNQDADVFYIFRGSGFFTQDNQIVEIPLPLLGNPPTVINTPFGPRVAYRSDVKIYIATTLKNAQNANRFLTSLP